MGVAVGVAQLVGDRIQEQVPPYRQPVNIASSMLCTLQHAIHVMG